MSWQVIVKPKVSKELLNPRKIPKEVEMIFKLLVADLQRMGPAIEWSNYGKLINQAKGKDRRHCHLQKGRPTWVACWEVDLEKNIIEVYYVGTHEKAPY